MVKTGRYWGDQVGDVLSQGPFHGEADRTCWQRECGMGEKRVQVGSKVLAWATKRRHARVLSCVQLVCNPIDSLLLSMEFYRQEYWSAVAIGLPFPTPIKRTGLLFIEMEEVCGKSRFEGKIGQQFWRKELQLILERQGLNGIVPLTCWFVLIVNTSVIHHLGW